MQARAQRTRGAGVLAAAEVFDRLGYAATTLDDIAEHMDATRGGLQYHFPSKAAIAVAVVEAHHEGWFRLMDEAASWGSGPLDTIGRLIQRVGESFATSAIARAGLRLGNEYELIDSELPAPFVDWIREISRLLRRGIAEGEVSSSVDPDKRARRIVASFFGIQEVSARLDGRAGLAQELAEWWQDERKLVASPKVTKKRSTANTRR